jgi:hypothetical protein
LLDVYHPDKHFWKVLEENEHKRMDIVFSILLSIRRPDVVKDFQDANIVDKELPLSFEEVSRRVKGHAVNGRRNLSDAQRTQLAKMFEEAQWRFRPHIFKVDDDTSLPFECILPILDKRPILNNGEKTKQGGTARVYQLMIPEEFLDIGIRNAIHSKSCQINDKLGKVRKYFPCNTISYLADRSSCISSSSRNTWRIPQTCAHLRYGKTRIRSSKIFNPQN